VSRDLVRCGTCWGAVNVLIVPVCGVAGHGVEKTGGERYMRPLTVSVHLVLSP